MEFKTIFVLILAVSILAVPQQRPESRLTLPNVLVLDDAGRITLAWEANLQREEITFEIEANTTGYVGFGISPQGSMTGADIFIAGVGNDGQPYFSVILFIFTV